MSFQASIRTVFFQKYANFNGRANRAEYWWWVLAVILLSLAAEAVDTAFLFNAVMEFETLGYSRGNPGGPIATVVGLATLIPSLAVTVRRLHDSDKSGWWIFVVIVPILGPLYFLFLMLRIGTIGPNRFDATPIDQASSDEGGATRGQPQDMSQQQPRQGYEMEGTPEPIISSQEEEPVEEAENPRKPVAGRAPKPMNEPQRQRPSWRIPSTRRDGFQTTQERFKDK